MRALRHTTRRRLVAVLAVLALAGVLSGSLLAYFSGNAAAGGNGRGTAASVNQGATPSASATAIGREVSLTWGATTLSNGQAVDGYVISRYPQGGGLPTLSPIGTCAGTVAATSCVEDDVPFGAWQYTVTPVIGAHWRGPESLLSGVVTIAGTTLTVNGSPFGNAAFTPNVATTTGSLTGFSGTGSGGHGEGVSYRLDASTGLTGSPSFVGTNGNAAITSLGIPKSAGDGPHTVYAVGDAAYFPSQASTGIVIDTTPPTATAMLSPAANGAGWNNTSPVVVTLAADDGTGSGLAQIKYTIDGSDPTTSGNVYSSPFTVGTQGTTQVKFYATDVAGNASLVQITLVKIDTVAPTNSISLNVVSGNALLDSGTIWYRGANPGSFTLANALSDGLSGPASTGYAALSGSTSGWSFTSSAVTSGPPYVSNAFSWSGGTSSSPTETATGYDVAGNSTPASLTFTNDSDGPAGGSVDATGLGGTGGRYSSSTSLTIAFTKGTDAGVGLASSGAQLLRASAPLSSSNGTSDGSCGSYGAFVQVGSNDPTSTVSDSVADHRCFKYEYVVLDRLGNASTYTSPEIKVDSTAPSAPSDATLSPTAGSSYQFVSGHTLFYNPAQSGSFDVDSSISDADSGIHHVTFPNISGFTGGGSVSSPHSGTSYRSSYSWSANGASPSPGAQSISATNNAGLTATNASAFTLTKDATAPSTTDNSASIGNGWKKTDQTVTLTPADNPGGSGVAATYWTSNGSTPTTGSSQGTSVALNGDGLYRVKYFSVDNVANQESVQTAGTTIRIDKTAPSPGALSLSSFIGNGQALTNAATDSTVNGASSGVASVSYYYCAGTSCTPSTLIGASSTGPNYSVTWSSQPADGNYRVKAVVTDTAGNSADSNVVSTAIDNTPPATTDNSASIGNGWKKTDQTVTLSPTDPVTGGVASGVASTRYTSDGSTPTTGSSQGTSVPLHGDGLYTVKYFSVDNVGNQESVKTAGTTIRIDETAPTPAAIGTAGAYVNGGTTYIANGQALTNAATDATVNGASSGVASVSYFYCSGAGCTPSTPIGTSTTGPNYSVTWSSQPADGVYRIGATVTDVAGNSADSAIRSVTIDNTKPSSSAGLGPLPNGAGWNKADVTVTLNATDAGSGVQKITYSATGAQSIGSTDVTGSSASFSITSEGTTTISFRATDNNGNVETTNTQVVKLDKTNPTISASAGVYTAGNWTNQTVTVHYTCSDGGSGVASCTADQSFSTDGITNSTSGTATDVAGNSAGASFGPIKVDKTNPTPGSFTLPSVIRNGQSLSNAATDPTVNSASSGVASVSYFYCAGSSCTPSTLIGTSSTGPNYSVTWSSQPADGTYQVLARVTDTAGNTADSTKATVTIDNTPPSVTITAPANNSFVNTGTPTFSGACSTGDGTVTVVVKQNGSTVQTRTASCSAGSYSVAASPALAENTYTAQASQTDTAGNTGSSSTNTFTVDTTAPTVTLTRVNGSSVSFPYSTTSNVTSVGGSCGTGTGDSGTVNVSITGSSSQSGSATCSSGSWTYSTSPALTVGSYTATATQTDSAGNSGSSGGKSITVNSNPPAPTITTCAASNSPTNHAIACSGTYSTAGSGITLTVYWCTANDAPGDCTAAHQDSTGNPTPTFSGGNWSINSGNLGNGKQRWIEIVQTDSTGTGRAWYSTSVTTT
jgi:hypothetical protein